MEKLPRRRQREPFNDRVALVHMHFSAAIDSTTVPSLRPSTFPSDNDDADINVICVSASATSTSVIVRSIAAPHIASVGPVPDAPGHGTTPVSNPSPTTTSSPSSPPSPRPTPSRAKLPNPDSPPRSPLAISQALAIN
ncbi:hypothetical protein RB195_011957 [Necator americanus]|uniref:Uncharacterized protein n=1 Tax=Necator americanus TaxID=51031 RepID=A0ABR1D5S0_NECAM